MMWKRTAIVVGLLVAICSTGLAETKFEQPILVTSAGQSVDVKLAGVLLDRIGVPYELNATITPVDLEGIKTLIVVPGYSSKGLGAAGISRDDETARVESILKAAEEKGIPVLVLHLGGKARRGVQSDEFNQMAVESATLLIIVEQGDEDGFFTSICEDKEIPMIPVPNMAGAIEPLKERLLP